MFDILLIKFPPFSEKVIVDHREVLYDKYESHDTLVQQDATFKFTKSTDKLQEHLSDNSFTMDGFHLQSLMVPKSTTVNIAIALFSYLITYDDQIIEMLNEINAKWKNSLKRLKLDLIRVHAVRCMTFL